MQQRREKIIFTAFRLFCARGIEHVPLTEVAKASGVGETTIYRYFETKTALVLEAFVKLWDSIMSHVEESAESARDYPSLSGHEQIGVWLDAFQQLYQQNTDFILFSYEAKLYLLRHQVKLSRNQQDMLMQSIKEPCLNALEKGRADGSIPIAQDSEDIFYAIWGAVRGYIVKIAIYGELYGNDSPWESRYEVMKTGILSALRAGWKIPPQK